MKKNKTELETTALKVREHIIRMSTDGGCFIGASLSCADLLVFLYSNFLNINKENLEDPNRDYLFLSKGHDVPALYGTLAEVGILEKERLKNHLKTNDFIYWHPNVNIPAIEFHSGSLGHLLSVAIGVAWDCKIKNQTNKIVVVLGDGELNEGSIWEALLNAAAHKLDNLIAVVDRNEFQANIRTEELIPLEPLEKKIKAFGWNCKTIDGHNFDEMEKTFSSLKPVISNESSSEKSSIHKGDKISPAGRNENDFSSADSEYLKEKPSVIIAKTKRGKGLPSIEERADRWFCNFSHEEIELLLKELYSKEKTDLKSETLIVR